MEWECSRISGGDVECGLEKVVGGVKIQVLDSSKMKNLFDVCSIQAYTSLIPPTLHF